MKKREKSAKLIFVYLIFFTIMCIGVRENFIQLVELVCSIIISIMLFINLMKQN